MFQKLSWTNACYGVGFGKGDPDVGPVCVFVHVGANGDIYSANSSETSVWLYLSVSVLSCHGNYSSCGFVMIKGREKRHLWCLGVK